MERSVVVRRGLHGEQCKGEERAPWRGVAGVRRGLRGEECRGEEGAQWRGVLVEQARECAPLPYP